MEVFVALCRALDVDGAQLFAEAVRAEEAATLAPEPPLSMQELRQRRLQADALPVEEAADARPRADDDDDWEPR